MDPSEVSLLSLALLEGDVGGGGSGASSEQEEKGLDLLGVFDGPFFEEEITEQAMPGMSERHRRHSETDCFNLGLTDLLLEDCDFSSLREELARDHPAVGPATRQSSDAPPLATLTTTRTESAAAAVPQPVHVGDGMSLAGGGNGDGAVCTVRAEKRPSRGKRSLSPERNVPDEAQGSVRKETPTKRRSMPKLIASSPRNQPSTEALRAQPDVKSSPHDVFFDGIKRSSPPPPLLRGLRQPALVDRKTVAAMLAASAAASAAASSSQTQTRPITHSAVVSPQPSIIRSLSDSLSSVNYKTATTLNSACFSLSPPPRLFTATNHAPDLALSPPKQLPSPSHIPSPSKDPPNHSTSSSRVSPTFSSTLPNPPSNQTMKPLGIPNRLATVSPMQNARLSPPAIVAPPPATTMSAHANAFDTSPHPLHGTLPQQFHQNTSHFPYKPALAFAHPQAFVSTSPLNIEQSTRTTQTVPPQAKMPEFNAQGQESRVMFNQLDQRGSVQTCANMGMTLSGRIHQTPQAAAPCGPLQTRNYATPSSSSSPIYREGAPNTFIRRISPS